MTNLENKLNILNSSNININKEFKTNLFNQISNLNKPKFSFMKINKFLFIPPVTLAVAFGVFSIASSFFGTNIMNPSLPQRDTYMSASPSSISSGSQYTNLALTETTQISDKMMQIYPYNGDERVSTSTNRYYDTDAYIALESNDLEEASDKVIDIVKTNKGLIDRYSINEDQKQNYGNSYMTFRIPQENISSVTREIKLLGYKVIAQNISVQDETVNVEDKEGNTENTIEYYERLINQLNLDLQDANLTESQKLEIKNRIEEYETIIGDMQNSVENLKQGLNFATLTVSIEKAKSFFSKLTSGDIAGGYVGDLLQSGSVAFIVLGLLLRFLGHVLVWGIVFGIAWLPVWLLVRFIRNRRKIIS